MDDWEDCVDDPPPAPPPPPSLTRAERAERTVRQRCSSWSDLLPHLEDPYAQYQQSSHGKPPSIVPASIHHICASSCEEVIVVDVKCLYISLQHGVFPASPTRPRTGVSIDLLEIYRALFERSCDAITALASALHTIYGRRGFKVISTRKPGIRATNPFRDLLGQAVMWSSNLRDRLQARLKAALEAADLGLFGAAAQPEIPQVSEVPEALEASVPPTGASPALTPGPASRVLRERCPACFGLEDWGRDLEEGGDVILGADGCFSYRQLRSAGDGPIVYDPTYFVSPAKVKAVRKRILKARKKAPAKYNPPVLHDAVDACEESWDAVNEKKQKADPKRYDRSGVFVLTCRHSQVLFLADVNTPGEQQQYIVALMEEVLEQLPPQATVIQGYDVGCSTDRSLNLYPILRPGLRERVSFIINAMHSYGHQWICQLFYSPRLRHGVGVTDLEGVERFWSRIRKLIGMTRSQWNSRRIWTIDQYTAFVNEDGRDGLGGWITRQQTKNVARKQSAALKVLRECNVPEAELRQQWEEQKKAQKSIRSHAPARLRRELDQVLRLQTQIDTVEKVITDTKESVKDTNASLDSLRILRDLEATHARLSSEADSLYASLNIPQSFPELAHLPIAFVRTLILMRDLKIWIRKRAVSTFLEWESLDQAVAGRREPIGTKLHQNTRRAIAKRKPALLNAIAKFNAYCAELERLRPAGCLIPIPSPLSPGLSGLRDDPTLQQDVWVTPAHAAIPRWLQDDDVRDGIRGLHAADRCAEEILRLDLERGNLRRWLMQENAIVNRAIEMSQGIDPSPSFVTLLTPTVPDPSLVLVLAERKELIEDLRLSASDASNASTATASNAADAIIAPDPTAIRVPQAVTVEMEDFEGFLEEADDEFREEILVPEELDPGAISDVDESAVIQDMLADDDPEEESSSLDAQRNQSMIIGLTREPRVVVRRDGRPNHIVEADDVDRIRLPRRLNNFALNGLAAALLNVFSSPASPHAAQANQCAVLSTYDVHRVRYKADDVVLWDHLCPTQYWDKPLWLIPIHRAGEEHWVFVVVVVRDQKLFFFDSLAQQGGWRRDLRDVMILVTRMVVLANRHHHRLHNEPRQSNGYDCGVWVVCMIGAILRGHADVALSEGDMGSARRILGDLILTLPFAS
ncbi:hypothetical protein C8R45DRAFT_817754 [Mycena sanguinolenta]|nr:hypothetical protein C8R45DRAFT_817754 [Mycena sanguinolenta]